MTMFPMAISLIDENGVPQEIWRGEPKARYVFTFFDQKTGTCTALSLCVPGRKRDIHFHPGKALP